MGKKIFLFLATLFAFSMAAIAEEETADGSGTDSGSSLDIVAPGLGGESVFDLSSPFALLYGSSVVGGGISYTGPTSIMVNPALAAREQRIGLNVGYTALIGTGDKASFGSAFQTAILIPFKWGVISGYLNGTFPNPEVFGIGSSINAKVSVSKEVFEHLVVGAGLNGGGTWGMVGDWSLSMNLGFVYDIPKLGFIKDFRYGASLLNLGKNYATVKDGGFLDHYPSFVTLKVGAAGLLFSNESIKLGASLDLTALCFRNMLFDVGFQFRLKDMLTISVAEKINLKESIDGANNYIPSVGVLFNFKFGLKGNGFLASHDWNENEMTAGLAYKNLYSDVQAVSVGADLLLGLRDETPPVITVWTDDDDVEE